MPKVKAELKSLFAPFVPGKLEEWSPEDPDKFGFNLQIFVGSTGDAASDSFDVTVCTPSWLSENWDWGIHEDDRSDLRLGRDLILMKRWDFQQLEAAIRKVCDVEANTWGDVANRIGRTLPWEYEYRYDDYQDEGRPFP